MSIAASAPPVIAGSDTGRRFSPGKALAWAFIVIVVIVTVFPFYWVLRTAFSNNLSLFTNTTSLLPSDFTLGAFKRVFGLASVAEAQAQGGSIGSVNFLPSLGNSVIYATLSTVCQLFFPLLAAYAFARLRWPGRDLVFSILLGALMVPGIFTLLPNFVTVKNLGLLQGAWSYLGLTVPGMFFSAFNTFYLRQFFLTINSEVEEAALLDGASKIRVLFKLIMPMSMAPIITLGILTYIGNWNDYFWPLLVSNDTSRPLTVALSVFKSQQPNGTPDWAGLMAAAVVTAIPMVVLFAALGRKAIDSIGFSGVK